MDFQQLRTLHTQFQLVFYNTLLSYTIILFALWIANLLLVFQLYQTFLLIFKCNLIRNCKKQYVDNK